ncbi:2-hydroxyacid dehydrogenase [Pediococcus claussenii]|nr:NAD(P)-dependent oxidoreductase [Pediococcus claussenii]ANZ70076.1 hydroxyacid dehydrogenase [Pediococcus claussenii]ANZ71891.1 hydroxyacid dehydrogenase [Pediococcus claussenii]
MSDKAVVLNAGVVNFDKRIDYSKIASNVVIYDETPEDKIIERVSGCTVVVTKEMTLSGDIIKKFPASVKMICESGTGFNNIDLKAATEKKIVVCNIPDYSSKRVAQTAIMFILNLASSMQKQISMLTNGNHDNFQKHLMVDHVEVNNKVLGVFGFGHVAKQIIQIAQAMDMKVIVATRTKRDDFNGIHFTTNEEVLKNSDFISLNVPLNNATKHMINEQALKLMKKSAFIVNTARGGLIDEPALIDALQNGEIAGAGLDVQEVEPLPDDSPLYNMDNVIITPHMGWKGLETRERLVTMIGENITAFVEGNTINQVN